jgi:hypothetical protein
MPPLFFIVMGIAALTMLVVVFRTVFGPVPSSESRRVYTWRDPHPALLLLGSLFSATALLALVGLAIKLYR